MSPCGGGALLLTCAEGQQIRICSHAQSPLDAAYKAKQELQRCFGQAASLVSRLKQSQHVLQNTGSLQCGFWWHVCCCHRSQFLQESILVKNTAVHMVKVRLCTNVILLMQGCTGLDGSVDAHQHAQARRRHAGDASCGYLQSLQKDGSVVTILQPDVQVKDVLVISSTCSMRCSCETTPQTAVTACVLGSEMLLSCYWRPKYGPDAA